MATLIYGQQTTSSTLPIFIRTADYMAVIYTSEPFESAVDIYEIQAAQWEKPFVGRQLRSILRDAGLPMCSGVPPKMYGVLGSRSRLLPT